MVMILLPRITCEQRVERGGARTSAQCCSCAASACAPSLALGPQRSWPPQTHRRRPAAALWRRLACAPLAWPAPAAPGARQDHAHSSSAATLPFAAAKALRRRAPALLKVANPRPWALTTMPMSCFCLMSTVLSRTRFMNGSKPRSVPVTWRLALSVTAAPAASVRRARRRCGSRLGRRHEREVQRGAGAARERDIARHVCFARSTVHGRTPGGAHSALRCGALRGAACGTHC